MDQYADIIAAAKARADADARDALTMLEAVLANAPEWTTTTHQGHSRPSTVPTRASLQGMLDHAREAYRRNHLHEAS